MVPSVNDGFENRLNILQIDLSVATAKVKKYQTLDDSTEALESISTDLKNLFSSISAIQINYDNLSFDEKKAVSKTTIQRTESMSNAVKSLAQKIAFLAASKL